MKHLFKKKKRKKKATKELEQETKGEPKEKREPILIQYIRDRIHNKNKNFLMLFCGATGSGKSYASLRLAELLDDTFDIDRCCFRAKEFMNKINELVESNEKVSGKVVVWDEFGVEHNAREFMTISNRVVNYFFQTSRHLNLIVIMTVPLLSFVDSATRKLCHAVAEMQGINIQKKTVSTKVKMIQTNVMTGKEYPKYLRYKKKSKMYVSKRLRFNLPSKELIEAYESKKKEFTTQLNKEIMQRLEKVEQRDAKRVKPLTQKQEGFVKLLFNHNVDGACKILKVNTKAGYDFKKACERKGVTFKPIWEDNCIIGHNIEGFNYKTTITTEETHI